MDVQHKRRLLLYGFLLSVLHFAVIAVCRNARLLLQRPEDMVGSGGAKPYWPYYPLASALERVGDILCLPFRWLQTDAMPDVINVFIFVINSILWGFLIAAILIFVFSHLTIHHHSGNA